MSFSAFKLGGNISPGGGPYPPLFIKAGGVGAKLADMIAGSWNAGCVLLRPGGSTREGR